MLILTIDIGGTDIKSAVCNSRGEVLKRFANVATQVSNGDNNIAAQVYRICETILAEFAVAGVAIATAGVVNPKTGEVVHAGPSIPNYTGTNLKTQVETAFGLPCTVENDVNAVALGEAWQGAAQNSHSLLCLTLGTGLGGAVIINGQLWHGANFTAGEIGYFPLPDGRRLEEAASTTALLSNYRQRGGKAVDGITFFKRLHAGDARAEAALTQMLDNLAQGLLPAIYLLAPQTLIIGGGIAAQKAILIPRLSTALAKRLSAPRFMPTHIDCAALGNQAGMIGALRCFLNAQST